MSIAFLGAMKDLNEQVLEQALAAMRESSDREAVEVKELVAETGHLPDVQPASLNGASRKANQPRS